ncbi:polycystin-2-like [Lepeophtheirus salmonis]|uniref:polycystin-2-like n=1 Tax=Lepeophtheirus salmonis TaxID=72036 RepID=UPI001AE425A0|nr:polycystin-2-like [Lepeophtheirus salmonis]
MSNKGPAWQDEDKMTTMEDSALLNENTPSRGCWYIFSKAIGGMWVTREMQSSTKREIYVRTTIRELLIYFMFLLVLCILTFGRTSPTSFYYTTVMSQLFEERNSVSKVEDLWKFMNNDLLNGLYWEYYYNTGNPRNFICPGGDESVGPCPVSPADRNILYENRLLGLPRIRQIRVKNDSCSIHQDLQKAIKVCYNSYHPSIEDKTPFQTGIRIKTQAEAWRYQSSETLSGTDTWGLLTTYSGAGSIQNLHSLRNESSAIVNELMENLWIGRGTRFISIDFTVYNANINLFCIVKLIFEFPATGGIIPSSTFQTVKLLRYVTTGDYFILANELIFAIFIIYYIIEEFIEIKKHRTKYFNSVWNNLDIFVIVISLVVISFNIYTNYVVENKLRELLSRPDKYADFTYLGFWSKQNSNAIAICVFFAWVKLFKYISFNKTMTQLSSTLSRSSKDVAGFGTMFFIVFFAFAQLGYLLFGTQVRDFSSFADSVFTLLRTILGDFNFNEIQEANRILGPIFFLSYVFFVFFVLLNMFLAIINDTYSEVKAELSSHRNEFEVGDYFKRGYNNILGKICTRNRRIDLENALKLANLDGEVTYEEIRQNLKKYNFSDMEIELFFSRYNSDNNAIMDGTEEGRVMPDLKKSEMCEIPMERPKSGKDARGIRSAQIKSRLGSAFSNKLSSQELEVLDRRVDRVEGSVNSIVSKINNVLQKLESLERGKAKKKATMSKILDNFTEDSIPTKNKKD